MTVIRYEFCVVDDQVPLEFRPSEEDDPEIEDELALFIINIKAHYYFQDWLLSRVRQSRDEVG